MRILNNLPVRELEAGRLGVRAARLPSREVAGDGVQLSSEGRFIQDLRNEVREAPSLRPSEVARARADVAADALGASDLDAAVDALLAGM
jgi:hypothetical protein